MFRVLWWSVFFSSILRLGCQYTYNEPDQNTKERISSFFHDSPYTNNWAVIVSASRYWFNYRHTANALGIYYTVKKMGLRDSHIILMLADDHACSPRNPMPATVFSDPGHHINLYGSNIEVDWRGYDVNVDNILRLFMGRHPPEVPMSKRLLTNAGSNILVYLTGHGGNEFLKIQDHEEINAQDLGDAWFQMHQKGRYRDILFLADTCEAGTLANFIYSPNIISYGSSSKGENSYSLKHDFEIGVSVIDRFTYYAIKYFERMNQTSSNDVNHFFNTFTYDLLESNGAWRGDQYPRPLNKVRLNQFVSSSVNVDFTPPQLPFNARPKTDEWAVHSAPLYHPHKPHAPHNMPVFPSREVTHLEVGWQVWALLGGLGLFTLSMWFCCADEAPRMPTPEEIQQYKERKEQQRLKAERKKARAKKSYPRYDSSDEDSSDESLEDFRDEYKQY
eukprot:TRINITY_DN61465_c0_g1_i1.p1 TRINITY_DN61465_c0_g1~~TRINITY_DN61465_c0_g1_i1.p1  ORF type:complete len:447 (+),score=22.70 TRINITY_DN61465_c0_g1_i1:153-1493(+)